MEAQNFNNHIRHYTPHHFVFYPVMLLAMGGCCICIAKYPECRLAWIAILFVLFIISWLSYMMRQHYALMVQNRVVRLEMRFRYYVLTQQRLEPLEAQLTFGRIAALRFAPDDELPALLQRTLKENLSAADIKKAIRTWHPDDMRV